MSRNSFLIKMCLRIETKSWDILLFTGCRLVKQFFFFIQIHWSNKLNYFLPSNCSHYRICRVSQTTPPVSVALNMSPHKSLLQLQQNPPPKSTLENAVQLFSTLKNSTQVILGGSENFQQWKGVVWDCFKVPIILTKKLFNYFGSCRQG